MIPLVDLAAQHREIADEVTDGWERVVARGAFVLGEEVAEFETAFASYSGVRHCVGVGNGTDALDLALRAAGIGAGDEVVVPAATFVATALAVLRAGARPVLADVDPDTLLLDVDHMADAMGSRTRAVLPVHLYGQVAPMEELLPIAEDAGAVVVEDAAQAQGASRHGIGAGSFGLAAGTSFYPGKNLGAYGDAGAVLTDDDDVASRVRALRNWGGEAKYEHPEQGFNSRLDTLQAVVLLAKLRRLEAWNDDRRRAAARYDQLLDEVDEVVRPTVLAGNLPVWHLYVVRVPDRDNVVERLRAAGIGAGVHYPRPLHLHGALRDLGHEPGEFPAAEAAAREVLSLPLFPGITVDQQMRVVDELRKALA